MIVSKIKVFWSSLIRRKNIDWDLIGQTELNRILTTVDLITLGVGATLGAGVYVLAGQIAAEIAGPAVIISFLIAAIASVLAGLCYAEFGCRVPTAGSAYTYSYVTVGEFVAFIIGWNLILEYVIGTASVARAWSGYFDSLNGGHIGAWLLYVTKDVFGIHFPTWLSPYPDFFAFFITMVLTGVLCIGVKESTILNRIFTVVNMLIVGFVIIVGFFKADFHNWNLDESEIPNKVQNATGAHGGFMPYGFSGVMRGAASCFYAFVGFDVIATTGEEVINPSRAIPIGIIVSLLVSFLAYFGVSVTITLMVPFYEFSSEAAPIPYAFAKVGWVWAEYIIGVGAICGLSASLLGGIVGMPRIVYAMARDGLIFKFLDKVSARFGTPLPATLVSGLFTAVFAALFSLQELVDMMSIGTLLAYLLVAMCVIILRYSPEDFPKQPLSGTVAVPHLTNGPTWKSFKIAVSSLCICICCFFALAAIFIYVAEENFTQATSGDTEIVVLTALCLLSIIPMVLQPQNKQKILFKVPFVPFIPLLSIFANIYLMLKLSPDTWVRFAAWMLIGFIIYFFYGLRKSGLKKESRGRNSEDVISVPITSNEGSPLLQRRNTRHNSGSSTDN